MRIGENTFGGFSILTRIFDAGTSFGSDSIFHYSNDFGIFLDRDIQVGIVQTHLIRSSVRIIIVINLYLRIHFFGQEIFVNR